MKIIKESINSKSNKLILDEGLFNPLVEDLSYYQDKVANLLSSDLVDTVEATDFNGKEAFKLTANDGKILYLVPSTLSQVHVYDNQGNVLDTNVFWRYIVDEFVQTEEAGFVYQLVGGDCAGTYTIDELKNLPCFDGKYSADQSEIRNNGGFTHRKELDNQPELNGYLGPIFNGWDKNHNAILRYETQEVYDALSESKLTEAFSSHIDLDRVVMDVGNLLDDSKLGDNWIEVFPTDDSYPIGNGPVLFEEWSQIALGKFRLCAVRYSFSGRLFRRYTFNGYFRLRRHDQQGQLVKSVLFLLASPEFGADHP